MDKKEKVDELETDEALPPGQHVNEDKKRKWVGIWSIAYVAGGISCASAFDLVAKPLTQVAKPQEDWWWVKLLTQDLAAHKSSCKLHLQEIR